MFVSEQLIYEVDTQFGHYQVVDMVYSGRPARVLFSGQRAAAQSAIPKDTNARMVFDYNRRFLELVSSQKPKSILLIGGGAFTLPIEVLKFFPNTRIDVVEHDSMLAKIANRFFGLKPNKNLNIINNDGREYLTSTNQNYDAILIDAFTHNIIPPTLSTKEFIQLLSQHLTKNGVVASNIISAYHSPNNNLIKQQYATYKAVFRHVDLYPADNVLSLWISQNFLLIATNKLLKPKFNLHIASLKPPISSPKDIQYDQN
jgi:spermidine synthase